MPLDRRCLIFGFAAAAQAAAVPGLAQPSSNTLWPTKTIIIAVPFPAGGSADLSARLLAEHLKTAFGQPVVVENKPGAGGNLAAAEAARAPADGHTLFIGTNGTQTINQSLYRQLPYDPVADFAPIGMMWSAPHLVAVHPGVPTQSLDAFIAYARSHPGELSYGSSGIGSSTHLFGELFNARTGISMVHVPYRGQGAALEDLIGGRIAAMFPIAPDVIASLRADQVRALALAANSVSEILPGVPPMPQLGYPELVASAWVALYAPAKTAAAVIERLRTELDALLVSSAFVERMKQVGIEVNRMRPDEFAAFAQQERSRWAKLIGSLDLKIE
ncbi:MAG TPA: tripartite tricarboxylate transporter substrate binding protein [Xanthobacteraceae bacterium]|nr:tripartite tricarboxylate transporter substrate binding protein [Xanthobacteraceae bacterium]